MARKSSTFLAQCIGALLMAKDLNQMKFWEQLMIMQTALHRLHSVITFLQDQLASATTSVTMTLLLFAIKTTTTAFIVMMKLVNVHQDVLTIRTVLMKLQFAATIIVASLTVSLY